MTKLVTTGIPLLAVGGLFAAGAAPAYVYAGLTLTAAFLALGSGHARVAALTRWFGVALLLFGLADASVASGWATAEPLYLVGYVVLAATALTALSKLGPTQLREGLTDGALVSVIALGLLYPAIEAATGDRAAIASVYFVATTMLTAVWVRVVAARPTMSPAGAATSIALLAGLIGTTLEVTVADLPMGAFWTLHGIARWGLAIGAVHPSFAELFHRDISERERDTGGRLMVMSVAVTGTALATVVQTSLGRTGSSLLLVLLPAPAAIIIAVRIARSIRSHVAAHEAMVEAASRDQITGLRNRAGLDAALRDDARLADGTVVLIVIDGLREMLRRLPDEAGRELLTRLRSRLSCDRTRQEVLGRCDTDEFAILTSRDPASVAARIVERLHRPLILESSAASFTPAVRAGWAAVDGQEPRTVLRRARFAAGEAVPGGSPVGFDARLSESHDRQRRILQALPDAIVGGLVINHYQPIVRLEDGAIIGFEALARWTDPELGRVGPMEFIPLAESSGAIIALGTRLLREACTQLAAWRLEHQRDDMGVTVNVSARQLEDDAFPAIVSAALSAADLPPHALTLELTEGVLLREGADEAVAVLSAVRAMGVRLAVDDFGTGYSSLAYLQRFRPDVVKIDRAFTRELGTSAGDVASGVFSMLDQLGWRVVAEGIELPESVTILRGLSCELGQGYLLSPPLPPDGAGDLLLADARNLTTADAARAVPTPKAAAAASSLPADDTGTSIADLVEPARVVDASTSCSEVERMFHETARLEMIVVRREDGRVSGLSASRVLTAMTGRYAYGRALNGNRPIGDLVENPVRGLSPDTSYVDAVAMALARPESERYDDLIVDGQTVGRLSVGRLLEAIAESLSDQAARDALTGIPNRRHLTRQLTQIVDDGRSVGLLLIDLDGFKPVNDTYGHAAGDTVLMTVAQRLRACARPRDIVARLGGDEFAVVVDGDERATSQVAERIRQLMPDPIDVGETTVRVSASIGATWGRWSAPDTALAEADAAMYEAKRAGGSQVVSRSSATATPA